MLKFIRDFNRRSQGQTFFCFIALALPFFLLPRESLSQISMNPPMITEVSIRVDGQPGREGIEELIPIKEGELFSLKKINSSIKQIYKTGLFSDIQVLRDGGQKVKLTFLLSKKVFVRKILFVGKREISRRKLKKSLYSLHEGDSFSEDKLHKAVEELKESLNKEGYFHAEIKTASDINPKTSEVDVSFEILSAKKFVVAKILFTGDVLLPEDELRQKMKTKEGKEFVPGILEEDLEKIEEIYQSMDYQWAEIDVKEETFDEEEGTVSIVLEIVPNERIEIVIRGADVPVNLLTPIWEARIFEEWGLHEGVAKIEGYLRKKGYLFPKVDYSTERDETTIRVIHDVIPGERVKVQEMAFEGLNYFTPSQIKAELIIREKIPFFKQIDGARLFELPREIEFLYKTHGFFETKVDLAFQRTGQKTKPIYTIEEGNQERIETISVEGARLFSEEDLLGEISSFQGGPFFQPNVQKDIEKLENFYLNQGVRGTEIRAVVQKKEDYHFSVNFQIAEGRKVKIENIILTGNEVTRRGTIFREVLIKEGDYAFYGSIRETKRRLERLGIFTAVKIEEIPLAPDKENLLINVREGERNYASLGLGMETRKEPRSFAIWNSVIRPRGTAELIRSNILGLAAQMSLVGQISTKERRAVVSWEQPHLFGLPMETFLNGWLEREERISYTFERRGLSLLAIRSLSDKESMVLLTTLRVARTTLLELQISESEVDRQHFPFSATSISGSFIWEKRDDPFNPSRGHFFSTVIEWAYPVFNDESDYQRTFSKFQHFAPIYPGVTFSSMTRIGLGRGRMPIHERFFGGGSNSFRGVGFDQLGPKDPNSFKPIGGKALLLFNFELTFPVLAAFEDLFGSVFYDTGNVFELRRHVSLASFRDAVGFGLRYRTPLGPIRVELGWNLDAPEYDKKALIFITIGNVF